VIDKTLKFVKALDIDHARDGEFDGSWMKGAYRMPDRIV